MFSHINSHSLSFNILHMFSLIIATTLCYTAIQYLSMNGTTVYCLHCMIALSILTHTYIHTGQFTLTTHPENTPQTTYTHVYTIVLIHSYCTLALYPAITAGSCCWSPTYLPTYSSLCLPQLSTYCCFCFLKGSLNMVDRRAIDFPKLCHETTTLSVSYRLTSFCLTPAQFGGFNRSLSSLPA